MLFLSILIMAILPHFGVYPDSIFQELGKLYSAGENTQHSFFLQAFTDEQTRTSILNSVKYASCSTLLDIVIGITAAWLIIRKQAFWCQDT